MNRNDTIKLLAYMQAGDGRTVGEADIQFWMDNLPADLDLELAKAAARVFFREAATKADERVFLGTRHFLRCLKTVKREREVEAARERAKRPALTTAYTPPSGGWRSLVPGGYGQPTAPPRVTEKHPTAAIPVITTSLPVIQPEAVRRDMGTFLDGFGRMA